MSDKLILVDSYDNEIGEATKLEAHEKALLHRAFSVFIVNNGKMLIQKRAKDKYHSGGLWANSCCSHPRVGETLDEAVPRRMQEELGFVTKVKELFTFNYFHQYSNIMHEFEYDHVFIGTYDGKINFSTDEIEEIKWIEFEELEMDLRKNPLNYSAWFHIACPKVLKIIKNF